MTKRVFTAALALALALALPAFAASPALFQGAMPSGVIHMKPQAMPNALTVVASTDAQLDLMTITNTTAGAITATVSSREASPIDLMTAVSIAANTTYVIATPGGYWMVGGFTVQAGGVGLNYYARWRQ